VVVVLVLFAPLCRCTLCEVRVEKGGGSKEERFFDVVSQRGVIWFGA